MNTPPTTQIQLDLFTIEQDEKLIEAYWLLKQARDLQKTEPGRYMLEQALEIKLDYYHFTGPARDKILVAVARICQKEHEKSEDANRRIKKKSEEICENIIAWNGTSNMLRKKLGQPVSTLTTALKDEVIRFAEEKTSREGISIETTILLSAKLHRLTPLQTNEILAEVNRTKKRA